MFLFLLWKQNFMIDILLHKVSQYPQPVKTVEKTSKCLIFTDCFLSPACCVFYHAGHMGVASDRNHRSTDSDNEEFCDSMEHLAMEEVWCHSHEASLWKKVTFEAHLCPFRMLTVCFLGAAAAFVQRTVSWIRRCHSEAKWSVVREQRNPEGCRRWSSDCFYT